MNEKIQNKKENVNLLAKILSIKLLFILHLFTYIAVMGLLTLIWALTISRTGSLYFWPIFPMLGWGYGIGFHAITYLMFKDLVPFLSKVRKESIFGILFIYHALFYILTNTIIIITNLTIVTRVIYFHWPLLMWGIGFGFHALGFFTWENLYNKECLKLKSKYPEIVEKKVKTDVTSKLTNQWILLAHLIYFLVVNLLTYIYNEIYNWNIKTGQLIEGSLAWSTILGIHLFGYYLFFYNIKFEKILKGLMLHIISYIAINTWIIYQNLTEVSSRIFFHYPLIIWGVALVIHVLVYNKWDFIKAEALTDIEARHREISDKFELKNKANRLLFWQWTFIAHLAIWTTGIIMISISIIIERLPLVVITYAALGWLIGVSFHAGCYICVLKNITKFLSWTAVLHLSVFISASVLLIVINVLFPVFPWSAITITGWGIGLGFHLILAHYLKI